MNMYLNTFLQSWEDTGILCSDFCNSFSDTLNEVYFLVSGQLEDGFTVEAKGWMRLNDVLVTVADNFAELETIPFR